MLNKVLGNAVGSILSNVLNNVDFSIANLNGKLLWLDSTQINNISVQWDDLSGNNNHAIPVGTPTIDSASLNGLDTVSLAGDGSGFNLTNPIVEAEAYLYCVIKGYGYLTANDNLRRTAFTNANALFWDNAFASTTPNIHNITNYQLCEFGKDLTNSFLRTNGQDDLSVATYQDCQFDRIGLKWDIASGIPTWTGNIAELIIFNNSNNRLLIQNYLSQKWGI